MRVEFYQLIQDETSTVDMAEIPGTAFFAPPEKVKETVEVRFAELIESMPETRNVIVLSPTIGEPPGAIIAIELVHAIPTEVRAKLGKPARELIWVVDESIGMQRD
jgi:hypothetical protein